jgi:polyisoprenoid-binding protein YceI
MTRKRTLIGGVALAALAVIAATGAVVWYTVLRDDAPSRVSLNNALSSMDRGTAGSQGSEAASLAGAWVLASGSDSFVGYRVKEELARIGATTAVGRTSTITATLVFDGSAITDVFVSADLTTLQSDSPMRDGQLRRQALETNTYPTATFDLTEPIILNEAPAEGVPLAATAVGDLTLHGVTRRVSIDVQGQRQNGLVVVVGSFDLAFADFNITPPKAASVLSVEDRGVLELQLVFRQESQG